MRKRWRDRYWIYVNVGAESREMVDRWIVVGGIVIGGVVD